MYQLRDDYQKVEIFDILGPHSHPCAPVDVKFCPAKRTQVAVGTAKFHLSRCKVSPLRGVKPDFWPVSENNTGSLIKKCHQNANSNAKAGNDVSCVIVNKQFKGRKCKKKLIKISKKLIVSCFMTKTSQHRPDRY